MSWALSMIWQHFCLGICVNFTATNGNNIQYDRIQTQVSGVRGFWSVISLEAKLYCNYFFCIPLLVPTTTLGLPKETLSFADRPKPWTNVVRAPPKGCAPLNHRSCLGWIQRSWQKSIHILEATKIWCFFGARPARFKQVQQKYIDSDSRKNQSWKSFLVYCRFDTELLLPCCRPCVCAPWRCEQQH